MSFGIDRDTGGFTEVHGRRKLEGIRDRLELNLRRAWLLRREGTRHGNKNKQEKRHWFHANLRAGPLSQTFPAWPQNISPGARASFAILLRPELSLHIAWPCLLLLPSTNGL